MTPENERDFQNSTSCYICGKKNIKKKNLKKLKNKFFYMPKLLKPGDFDDGKPYTELREKEKGEEKINRRVRDHCHITGKYRGSAHRDCNLSWSLSPENY